MTAATSARLSPRLRDLGRDHDEEGGGHQRDHRGGRGVGDLPPGGPTGRPCLKGPGQGERDDDQDDERLDERAGLDDVGQCRAHEQIEEPGQQQHLRDQQQRCGGQQAAAGAAGQPGEDDHVIHARAEQDEQHTDPYGPVGGEEDEHSGDHQWYHHEVDHQGGAQEPAVAQRADQVGGRDLEERHEQQRAEHRVDGVLQAGPEGRCRPPHQGARRHGPEIHRDLVVLHPLDGTRPFL